MKNEKTDNDKRFRLLKKRINDMEKGTIIFYIINEDKKKSIF